MPTSTFAVYLSDRRENENSTRAHASTMRWLFESGSSIRQIANIFGKSYEWTRRIVKDLAYDYADDSISASELSIPAVA